MIGRFRTLLTKFRFTLDRTAIHKYNEVAIRNKKNIHFRRELTTVTLRNHAAADTTEQLVIYYDLEDTQ